MANRLKIAQHAIVVLAQRGWSYRRIARELGVHRDTVAEYVRRAAAVADKANPAISIAGCGANPAISITGVVAPIEASAPTDAPVPPESAGRRSTCQPYRAVILSKLEQGLTAQRIWQALRTEHDFAGSYQSVQRFVRKLRARSPLPFRRTECSPGEEAQVDFGRGAPIRTVDGCPYRKCRPALVCQPMRGPAPGGHLRAQMDARRDGLRGGSVRRIGAELSRGSDLRTDKCRLPHAARVYR